MLPKAHVVHRTSKRVRFRIPARKGVRPYFDTLRKKLSRHRKFELLQVNASTGGVLAVAADINLDALADYGREHNLFDLQPSGYTPRTLAQKVAAPLDGASGFIRRLTGGDLDLAGATFLSLLGVGVYQAVRGRFQFPPWYTAFWYAFGLFTKSLIDRNNKIV